MMRPLQILLIEDDEDFALTVDRTVQQLKSGHTVTRVVRITCALQRLADIDFDIVLADLSLPDASGLECVEQIHSSYPDIPLIVLTSMGSQEQAAFAVQAGAQDNICKDLLTPGLLDRTIWHAIERQKIWTENTVLIIELMRQQEKLNQKNAELQQLVKTAHRFVDNVSHEFRTPLTVIREYAALMSDGLLGEVPKEQQEFLDVIRYRVDDLNTMVDDMLDSSKLAAGIMGMDRVTTSVQSIVERPLEDLKLKAQVRGIELICSDHEQCPAVFCDPEKAGRVVTNLVSNAIKFSEDGQGTVRVSASHLPESQNVEICVIDDGPGIEADDLGVLFERFRQLGTGTQNSTKGFGLGLNIASELVDQNFGTIRVESKVDVGTTFRFTIPVDNWPEIVRRYVDRVVRDKTNVPVAVLRVRVKEEGENCQATQRDIDTFWRFTDRQPDLVRRTAENQWTLLFTCEPNKLSEVIESFERNHARVNRNRTKPMASLHFEPQGCFRVPHQQEDVLSAATSVTENDERQLTATEVAASEEQPSRHQIPAPAFLRTNVPRSSADLARVNLE